MKQLSARRISIILTILALIIWAYSITLAKFAIGKYGLIRGFPTLFFVSLGILTLASVILWTSKENHWKLLLLQLGFLMISLFIANLISGGAQSLYTFSLGELGNPEYITRTGHINTSFWQLWQSNWPGNDIFQSLVLLLTGRNINDFANAIPWLPIIWQILFFFPVFVFFKNTFGKTNPNYVWAGMWIFYLASWVGIQNNGPQPFGTFFVFAILAIFSSFDIWKQNVTSLGHRTSSLLIFTAVTVSHFLSSLVALSILAGNFIFRRLRTIKFPIIAATFIIAWAIYGASVYNTAHIPNMANDMFQLGEALQTGVGNRIIGNASHSAVSIIRVIFSGLIISLSLLGGVLAIKNKHNRYIDISILGVLISMALFAAVVGGGYSHELLNRFFIYTLPALVYFGIKLVQSNKFIILLVGILLVGIPLSFISQYGNEEMDYLTSGYLSGANSFQTFTTGGEITGSGPIGQMRNAESYHFQSFSDLISIDGEINIEVRRWVNEHYEYYPHYVVISNHDQAILDFYSNKPDFVKALNNKLNSIVRCNLAFANPDIDIYLSQAQSLSQ